MKNSIFLFIISLFLLNACSEDDSPVDSVEIKWEIAQCCNPWDGFESETTDLEVLISSFFSAENIDVLSLGVEDNGLFVFCGHCCGCPAGKTVIAEIPFFQLQKALDLGFEEN